MRIPAPAQIREGKPLTCRVHRLGNRTTRIGGQGENMGTLDTIAITLLSLFCLGIIGLLWIDWRGMVRNEPQRHTDSQDSTTHQERSV